MDPSECISTRAEYRALAGVLAVREATPTVGYVTLVVAPGYERVRAWLDPGFGDGRGHVPVGTRVLVKVPGWTTMPPNGGQP